MAIVDARVARKTWRGAPLLDVEPFREWIQGFLEDKELTVSALAAEIGVDERRVRMWLGISDGQPTVSEPTVEKVGIKLLGDPRLVAQLYPEYDF